MAYLICENCNHYWQINSEEEFWVFYMCDECGSPLLYVNSLHEYRNLTKNVPESFRKTHAERKAERYWRLSRAVHWTLPAGALIFASGLLLSMKNIAWAFLLIITGPMIIIISLPIMKMSEMRGRGWKKGHVGELIVASCLRRLPQGYHIFNDVHLPGAHGNIDHIVVGPTGVYVIETKSYSGKYIVRGDRWFLDDDLRKEEIRSPSTQAKRNAATLKEFLESEEIYVSWVNAIVAFINSSCTIMEDDEYCMIMKPCQIPEHISRSRLMLGEGKVNMIVDVLRNHASEVW
ncbi:NERD domain-containing protein [Methanothermobacter thermautotrophicus]|jgi:hypothetical protein|uniref:NERD domain-containing protein n=1 Tax=Methanothermobacter thermautotrophicus TaxID=145262 RepID=A0A842YMW1_METTF|nr:nuclease-related domain-containing protein [Methanothermobacter thermautotrophicus]MBE2900726.1 NERD domain-containing protein [Methanothermobacter thermautotrophicus]MCQ8904788.1 NERD domain-containing protein [Methanothermobacter sp.]